MDQQPIEQVGTIIATWEAIPFTLRVAIIFFLVVVMLTEMGKRTLFVFIEIEQKQKKYAAIWLMSFILGAVVAFFGWIVTDTMPNWFWLAVGATAGTVSNIIHHLVVKVWWRNRTDKKSSGRVVSKEDVLKMPKPEGNPDAPTEYFIKRD